MSDENWLTSELLEQNQFTIWRLFESLLQISITKTSLVKLGNNLPRSSGVDFPQHLCFDTMESGVYSDSWLTKLPPFQGSIVDFPFGAWCMCACVRVFEG